MKKVLIAVGVVIAAIVIGLVVFSSKIDGLIADLIRTEGTAALNVAVDVKGVKTDFKQGSAVISGLTIANPEGFSDNNALSVNEVNAEVNYGDQTIELVQVIKPVINAEMIGSKSNFLAISEGLPESEPEPASTQNEEEIELTLNKFVLSQATVNLVTDTIGNHQFVMDDFVLTNLKGTASQLADTLSDELIAHLSNQVKAFAIETAKAAAAAEATARAKAAASEKLTEQLNKGLDDKVRGLNLNIR